jgi:hypothetical protein
MTAPNSPVNFGFSDDDLNDDLPHECHCKMSAEHRICVLDLYNRVVRIEEELRQQKNIAGKQNQTYASHDNNDALLEMLNSDQNQARVNANAVIASTSTAVERFILKKDPMYGWRRK